MTNQNKQFMTNSYYDRPNYRQNLMTYHNGKPIFKQRCIECFKILRPRRNADSTDNGVIPLEKYILYLIFFNNFIKSRT